MKQWSSGEWCPDDWEGTEEYRRVRFAAEQERIERKQKLEMVNEFLRREIEKNKPKSKAKGAGN
jgi:hypothetical protein